MGILDKVKGLVSGRREQIKSGIDKASDVAERRVGAKHAGKVEQAADKAKGAVDKISGDSSAPGTSEPGTGGPATSGPGSSTTSAEAPGEPAT